MKNKALIILLLIIMQTSIFAQTNYVHYTVKDGLPQMQCMTLFQDSKGYIWIGTKGGISKYDGINFKNYTINDGLPKNRIYKINEDSKGNIWVLTDNGLSVLKNEKFIYYPAKKGLVLKSLELIIDIEDNIWFFEGSSYKKLIKFKDGKYIEAFSVSKNSNSNIRHLTYDKNNNIIYFSEYDKKNINHYTIDDGKLTCNKGATDDLYLIHKENLGIRDFGKKANYRYKMYSINNADTVEVLKQKKTIYLPKRLNDSTIIFTTIRFKTNMPLHYIINGKLQDNPKHFDYINDILQDSENNIWLASEKGLYKITPFNNYTQDDGMLNYVWSVAEDKSGKIWFSSYGNPYLYYMQDNKLTKYPKKFKNYDFFFGAITTRKGAVLFPTAYGIYIYKNKHFSFDTLKISSAVLSIYEETTSSKLYFGSFGGLIIKDSLGNIEVNKRFIKEKENIVMAMLKNKKDELWYVTRDAFGILNRKDTLIMHNDTIKGAMCLYCDYKDNLWIGTDKGLFLYNYHNFTQILHHELQTMIGSIVQTDNTHFVYGGLRGIGIFDLKKFYAKYPKLSNIASINAEEYIDYYTQSHGFLGEEIGQVGIFKDRKGRVWVPTNNNVVMFYPKDLKKNLKPPYVYISSFQSSEDNINWKMEVDSIIDLNYKKTNIRIEFTGISHTAPDLVKYKFRLKGFNDSWSNETKERYVTYTNLPPGKYSFQLLAKNNNNIWNLKPVIKDFEIVPAWWQTVLFKLVSILFTLIAIFLLVRGVYKKKVKKAYIANRLNKLQLQSKQSQLYPHLLFNTASAAGSVIYKENKEKAYDFVVKLSQFMRHALEDTKRLYKSLQDEIDFVNAYLQLQKMRFSERFDYKINIDKNVDLSVQIPQMIIQTYVENAVKYGLEPLKEGGFLEIKIIKKLNIIKIIIEDNGVGIEEAEKLMEKGTGSGIKIMNEIYEIHNETNNNKIYFKLIDLYKLGKTGTQSIIEIKNNK